MFLICGGHFVGGFVPLDGTIEHLRVVAHAAGADVTWTHEGVTESHHRYAVAVDGDLVAVLPAGGTSTTLTGIPPGEHRLDVLPIRADVRRIPDLHGDPYGDRAHISWPASPSEDLEAYLVFMDDEPAATVAGSFVQGLFMEAPTSGTGTGRITVSGSWTGGTVNRLATIGITDEGFTHDVNGGDAVLVSDFAQGDEFDLPGGVRVRFESPRADYDDGDAFEFRIGPRTSWSSGRLPAGEHSFTVKGRDVAGNVSDPLDETTLVIFGRPAPVSALVASWSGTQVELTWTAPEDPDENVGLILVYANWSPTFERLLDRINLDAPFATLAASATSHTFTPAASGLWKFQVETTHTDHLGRSLSAESAEVDTDGLPTSVHLSPPTGVVVSPAAGGELLVRWTCNASEGVGEDVTVFRIYVFDSEDLGDFEDPETVPAPLPGAGGFIAGEATIGPFDGERWIVVRASDGTLETLNTDAHSAVPDDEPPTMAESVSGVPN